MDEFGLAKVFASEGIAPGAMRGYNEGVQQGGTLANTAFRKAETDRYLAQTPDSNRLLSAQAEAGRLGNLQGQANEQVGLYDTNAQAESYKKKMEAQKAKELWDNLEPDKKAEAQKQARAMSNDMVNVAIENFSRTGRIVDAFNAQAQYIQANAHKLPKGEAERMLAEIEKGLVAADRKYRNNPQAWLVDAKKQQEALTQSALAQDPKHAGTMEQQAAQDAEAFKRTKYTADAGVRSSQISAESRAQETKKMNADEVLLSQIKAANPSWSDSQVAQKFVEIKTTTSTTEPSILYPQGKTKVQQKGAGTTASPIKLD